ncbi:MAG: hypothetical protein S4CHLAM102_12890 [Chlamydiia bacterium]|nr:hypothetical protein [Chlamydiia bacterium]
MSLTIAEIRVQWDQASKTIDQTVASIGTVSASQDVGNLKVPIEIIERNIQRMKELRILIEQKQNEEKKTVCGMSLPLFRSRQLTGLDLALAAAGITTLSYEWFSKEASTPVWIAPAILGLRIVISKVRDYRIHQISKEREELLQINQMSGNFADIAFHSAMVTVLKRSVDSSVSDLAKGKATKVISVWKRIRVGKNVRFQGAVRQVIAIRKEHMRPDAIKEAV